MSWEGALRLALYMARPPHPPSPSDVVLTARPRSGGRRHGVPRSAAIWARVFSTAQLEVAAHESVSPAMWRLLLKLVLSFFFVLIFFAKILDITWAAGPSMVCDLRSWALPVRSTRTTTLISSVGVRAGGATATSPNQHPRLSGRRTPTPPTGEPPACAAATRAAADSAPAGMAAAAAAALMVGDTTGTLASRCTSRGRRCWCTASSASRGAPGHPQSQVAPRFFALCFTGWIWISTPIRVFIILHRI
jgi:hypothetical protein